MTHIFVGRNGNRYEIRIQGHADYAKQGDDIVCAAISALSYTLMQSLLEAEEAGIIRGLQQCLDRGDIRAGYESIHHGTAGTILNTILCGFRMVEERYPENCEVILEDRGVGEK